MKPGEPELELDPEPKINNFGSASQSLLRTYILICFISFSYGTFYAGLKRLVAKHFNSVKGGKNCGRA